MMGTTILYSYLIFITIAIFYISKKGTFYIFSPFIFIYISLAVNDVVPLLQYDDLAPDNLWYVTTFTAIINIVFFFIYRRNLITKVADVNVQSSSGIGHNRKKIAILFLGLIVMSGILTGVTKSMLIGASVEDMRRTNEIGIGIITQIPGQGLPLLFLAYLFQYQKNRVIKNLSIALIIGFIVFLATAARGGILTYITIFFVWYNVRKRGFKWYEYFFIFFILQQMVAAFLFAIRNGEFINIVTYEQFFAHQYMIFGANTIRLMNYINDSNILMGQSYYYPLVQIIPRFIWPDKPVAIDYVYKEMVGMNFEGGGIYTTVPNELYLNFGTFYFIFYIAWVVIIHSLYKKLLQSQENIYDRMIILSILALASPPGSIISSLQLIFLFLLICYCINKRWKVF
ncbi:hypothetical protein [Bacteroides sp.]|uniref:hypothetical protein n=1 Tax=Bacteroides sp. TaxID=29523 RepID=UPI002586A80C|nr:hypothetical protein [Bacteroides sp.]